MKRQNLLTAVIFGLALGGWALLMGIGGDDPQAGLEADSLSMLADQLSSLADP